MIVDGETFKFRQLPSGILSGKVSVLGAGCVVDPEVLLGEIDDLEARGISADPLKISGNAHLIMPWHIAIDGASEKRLGKLQIGTTRRGIGPAYADKAARIGIRVQDLLDPKILRQKIETALAEKNVWLVRVYEHEPFELEDVASRYEAFAQRLRPYVADTSLLVDDAIRAGKRVLLEGAQGTLLDLDHGTYPFVTSSNPIAGAAATGIGIGPTRIDEVLGVSKAYVTRVGAGPFPSEMDDEIGGQVRELGQEFGTVTGRERRPGWLDLVALRYAVRLNGITSLALTKLDVLSAFDELQVCVRYRLPDGTETPELPGAPERLPPCRAGDGDRSGLGRAARRLRHRSTTCPRRPAPTCGWSSSPSTCRSGSSGREPRASRCSRRRMVLDHLPGIDVDVVDLPRAAAEEETLWREAKRHLGGEPVQRQRVDRAHAAGARAGRRPRLRGQPQGKKIE